jgi:hypothetical protein
MAIMRSRHPALMILVAGAATVIGSAMSWADHPGHKFVDIRNNQALVVQPPHDQAQARILSKPTKVPDDVAEALAAGAQPIGENDVILVHNGQLYIVPDKAIKGRSTSQMMTGAAPKKGN